MRAWPAVCALRLCTANRETVGCTYQSVPELVHKWERQENLEGDGPSCRGDSRRNHVTTTPRSPAPSCPPAACPGNTPQLARYCTVLPPLVHTVRTAYWS